MSLFNRRFTPAYDILQAKKRAGAPSFAELDNSRLLPKNGTAGQVPVVQASGAVTMEDPSTGMTLVERMNYFDLLTSHNELRVNAVMDQLAFRGVKYEDLATGHNFNRNSGARIQTIASNSIGQVDLGYASEYGFADGKANVNSVMSLNIRTDGEYGSGIQFSADETRFWTTHDCTIMQWACEVAGDVDTATIELVFSLNYGAYGKLNNQHGLSISNDGQYLLLTDISNRILCFKFNTVWDARAGFTEYSANNSQSIPSIVGKCWGDNGNKVYILSNSAAPVIYQQSLSEPYNVGSVTATISTTYGALSGAQSIVNSGAMDLVASPDGTKLFWTAGTTNRYAGSVRMLSAWDLNNVLADGVINSYTGVTNSSYKAGLCLSADGNSIYLISGILKRIYKHSLSTAFTLAI